MFKKSTAAAAAMTEQMNQGRADVQAVTEVVRALAKARTPEQAVQVALDTVRDRFGWVYGSYWSLDPTAGVLRFAQDSGDAGAEFRRVTLEASFAEGVGLSGRAWRQRDLVFVADLAEMTDCVRAPSPNAPG